MLNEKKQPRGMIIVISAPSGAGKTTLVELLRKDFPDIYRSVSCTTRSERKGEAHGKDYIFVSDEKFKKMVENNEFAEWAEVHGNMYGTPKAALEESLAKGKDVLLDIDVQGAEKIRELYPNALFIFIMPPSIETLRKRLLSRQTENKDSLEIRLKQAVNEMRYHSSYNYTIVNEDLKKAELELKSIIKKEKKKSLL
ncbi:MAG: guanylate kinase [bacterium]|nr:guanylate kinase [bacterium]